MRAEPALVPEANCSTTKGSRPMASLSQACYVLPCLVTPLQWDLALSFSSVPTGEVGHLGGPSAQESLRGNEAKGNCLLAPSLSHAGSCGLLQSSGCYAALFIQGEPGREQERASSRARGHPQHLPRQEARSSGLRGWGRARAGQAWGCSVPAFLDPLAALSVERSWKLDSSGDRSLASGWRSER